MSEDRVQPPPSRCFPKSKFPSAAVRYEGETYTGLTHPEAYEKIPGFSWHTFDFSKTEDGFVLPGGNFLTRQQASKAVGALKDELFSEDIYGMMVGSLC